MEKNLDITRTKSCVSDRSTSIWLPTVIKHFTLTGTENIFLYMEDFVIEFVTSSTAQKDTFSACFSGLRYGKFSINSPGSLFISNMFGTRT